MVILLVYRFKTEKKIVPRATVSILFKSEDSVSNCFKSTEYRYIMVKTQQNWYTVYIN